jgi:hypothetical protein
MSFIVSDSEYYTLRRRKNENSVSFFLSPYSCMNPLSLYLDQVKKEISVYLRDEILYKGIADISKIKEALEKLNKLNCVEVSTLLAVLTNESEAKKYVTGRMSIIDKLIFTLAYESSEELRRKLNEVFKTTNPEMVLNLLYMMVEQLPLPLKEPMLKKLKPYLQKGGKLEPINKKKKAKKEKVIVYA